MEYIQGSTLANLLEQKDTRFKFDLNDPDQLYRFWETVIDLTSSVDFLHSLGFVHKDLHAENFMFDATNNIIKLIDLGSACSLNISNTPSLVCKLNKVLESNTLYMAPEIFNHYGINPIDSNIYLKGDVWSLGILLTYIINGSAYYHHNNVFSDNYKTQMVSRKKLRSFLDNNIIFEQTSNDNVNYLLTHMLDKNPDTRWTIHQVLEFAKSNLPHTNYENIATNGPPRFTPVPPVVDVDYILSH